MAAVSTTIITKMANFAATKIIKMMKYSIRTVGLIMAAVVVISSVSVAYAKRRQKVISVVSYNIRHGEGIDGKTDYKRIARHFNARNADVVAVQEVDSATSRSNGAYVLERLAACLGLYPTFAKAIDFEGGAYGIGILSREKPLDVRRVSLPGREEARVLLLAEFEDYVFGCMHLSLTPEDQLASVPIIMKHVKNVQKPVILAGDWNALPDDAFVKKIKSELQIVNDVKQATYPADKPDSLLDYIAVKMPVGMKVEASGFVVIEDRMSSDHRPIAVQLKMAQ